MHAYLITGKSREDRTNKAWSVLEENQAIDTILIETPKTKHQIKDVRELIRQLGFRTSDIERPRGLLFEDAHLLTTEAANSFLKTLEEPPGKAIIVLTAPNTDSVLETIGSRCMNIELGIMNQDLSSEEKDQSTKLFEELTKASIGERLSLLDKVGGRKEAIEFCMKQLYVARELLRQDSSEKRMNTKKILKLIENLQHAKKDLENNVNVKLVIGDLFLHFNYLT